jgi:hypothetical protein
MDGAHGLAVNQLGTGPIEDGGYTLEIAGVPILANMAFKIPTSSPRQIQLRATEEGNGFIGFFIRLEGQGVVGDSTFQIADEASDIQISRFCITDYVNAAGLTHTYNDFKSGVQATLQLTKEAVELVMEVTVMKQFPDRTTVEWYFSRFTVDATMPDQEETSSPLQANPGETSTSPSASVPSSQTSPQPTDALMSPRPTSMLSSGAPTMSPPTLLQTDPSPTSDAWRIYSMHAAIGSALSFLLLTTSMQITIFTKL